MARSPEIEDFTELYQHAVGGNKFLSGLLPGHLAIEFLLKKIIGKYDEKLISFVEKLRHAQLIDLVSELGLVNDNQKAVLRKINSLRNKLAHQISFEPTIDELKLLWREAANAFSDLTDGISQGAEFLEKTTKLDDLEEWVVPELLVQIAYDLHEVYIGLGGDHETF